MIKIKQKTQVITLLMMIMAILSGCQPTPDDNVVNQRDYDALLETAPSDFKLEYPANYTDNFMSKDKKVEITFDAEIIVPDVEKYPVIQIDPQPVTDEQIQLVVDEFMEGKTGYYPEKSMTKAEVEAKLIELKARKNDVDGLYEKYGDEDQVNAALCNINGFIEEYIQMLETAPESTENILSYFNFRPDQFYDTDDYNYISNELAMTQEQLDERESNTQEPLYLITDVNLSNGEYIRMFGYNEPAAKIEEFYNFGMHNMEHYEIHIVRGHVSFVEKYKYPLTSTSPFNDILESGSLDKPYPELTISLEEAEAFAKDTMHSMGIDNFYLVDSRIVEAHATYEETTAMWEIIFENPDADVSFDKDREDKFYLLTFKPMYYGIPLIAANNKFAKKESYNLPFAFEEIKVRVANDSIAEFRWTNPTDVLNVINDNVELLDFDEIIRIATKHMELKYNIASVAPVWPEMDNYEEELAKFTSGYINITEIRLGLAGVAAYNNISEYMLIPVWSFYGSYGVDTIDDSSDIDREFSTMPFLSMNAVDGSVIEQYAWQDYN